MADGRGGSLRAAPQVSEPARTCGVPRFSTAAALQGRLADVGYLTDDATASTVVLADQLGKPVLVEGPAGTGKTELAHAVASVLGVRVVRLQCHEGIDESKALYEWNYRKQLLRLQVEQNTADAPGSWSSLRDAVFEPEFLLDRPLLEVLRAEDDLVLLVDEVDRISVEAEALLLEVLAEYQVSIPELGTVATRRPPLVILTSNNTRDLSDGLTRRCLGLHLEYPDEAREREIVLAKVPGIADTLAAKLHDVAAWAHSDLLLASPSVRQAIEWARTLTILGMDTLGAAVARDTLQHLLECEADLDRGVRSPRRRAPVAALLAEERGGAATMLAMVSSLVRELRAAGVPVSLKENLDAHEALQHVPLDDRDAVKACLAATLVKSAQHWRAFDTVFEVYFSPRGAEHHAHEHDHTNDDALLAQLVAHAAAHAEHRRDGLDDLAPEELAELLLRAVLGKEDHLTGPLVREAVQRYAGMEPGNPLAYYLYRTLRNLDLDTMLERLLHDGGIRPHGGGGHGPLQDRLQGEELREGVDRLRREVEVEIRRRMVARDGVLESAAALREALPEDVDFSRASRDELVRIHDAIEPLTRKLAARLVRKRRSARRGPLDFRSTVRRSLSYGGVLAEPRFRRRRPSRPEVVVLADISGSVAAFTRFTLHFVYAVNRLLSQVRVFVFISGVDDVTEVLSTEDDVVTAVRRVTTETDVAWVDGLSDYGHALDRFRHEHLTSVGPQTILLVLGDARNNHRPANAMALKELAARARSVFWLNPEPRDVWDTTDSIMSEYAPYCDDVVECRNLRQLGAFVERLG